MADRVVTPLEGSGHLLWDADAPVAAPLRLHGTTVDAAWVDYNDHMSESCYLLVFGDNADAFFRYVGVGEQYRADGRSLYTVQTHLHHLREASVAEPLSLTFRVLDHDATRLHVFQEMVHGATGALLATAEQLLVHVDVRQGRAAPMPSDLRERVSAIERAHAVLPRPDQVGKPMGIRRQPTD